jgi:hypothetical protein
MGMARMSAGQSRNLTLPSGFDGNLRYIKMRRDRPHRGSTVNQGQWMLAQTRMLPE